MAGQWLRGWAVGTPTPSGLSLPRALTIEGSASIWGAVGQSGGRDIDGNRYFIYMGRKCWDVCAERRFCFCVVYKAVKYHYQAGGEEGAIFFILSLPAPSAGSTTPYTLLYITRPAQPLCNAARPNASSVVLVAAELTAYGSGHPPACVECTQQPSGLQSRATAAYVPQRSAVEPLPRRRQTCRFHRRL